MSTGRVDTLQRLRLHISRARRRLMGRRGSFILLYHRTAHVERDPWNLCVSPDRFAQHMRVLRAHCRPTRLTELARAAATAVPDGACAVTFDDGYADNLEHALPALVEYDIPATIFLATGYVGRGAPFWWDELERILLAPKPLAPPLVEVLKALLRRDALDPAAYAAQSPSARGWRAGHGTATPRGTLFTDTWRSLVALAGPDRESGLARLAAAADVQASVDAPRALTRDELLELRGTGHVDFGAHTVTHAALPELPAEAQRDEVLRSRSDVRALTGKDVAAFSYPHGRFDDRSVEIVREAGFTIACSVAHHPPAADLTTAPWEPFLLPRVHVSDWDGPEFERRLLGGFRG